MAIILITGAARSGKSSYAERLTESFGKKVVYVATAEALDGEMKRRIALHKKRRDKRWMTLEEPLDVSSALRKLAAGEKVILLDCLTLLISNLIHKGLTDIAICKEINRLTDELDKRTDTAIIVTNETGSGVVPYNRLARRFRDLQGKVNQIAAKRAASVFLMVAGIPVKIKG